MSDIAMPDRVTPRQLADTVLLYLRAKMAVLNQAAAGLVLDAIEDAFHCSF
jgi:hypothetical protein